MKYTDLGNTIIYIEDVIPKWKEFIDAMNNHDPDTTSVIPEQWTPWIDGGPSKEDPLLWTAYRQTGWNKHFDWDEGVNNCTDGTLPHWQDREEFRISPPEDLAHKKAYEIIKMIDDPVRESLGEYYKNNPDLPELKWISKNYDVRRYDVGRGMGPHMDASGPVTTMDISILVYLNDDYVGGEIYFDDIGLEIKPTAGSILMFRCAGKTLHGVRPITEGLKYYIPLFVHSQYHMMTGFREMYMNMFPY